MKKIYCLILVILTILLVGCEPKHIHIYKQDITSPTCTVDGKIIYTCECGFSYTEPRDALGHDFSEWVVESEATCGTEGLKKRTCKRCSEIETITTPQYTHPYEEKWYSDDTYHWLKPICEHTEEQVNKQVHKYDINNICVECGYEIQGTKGLVYKLSDDGSGYIVTGFGDVKLDEIEVPSRHLDLEVIGIGKSAFNANFNLTYITLPNTIKFIDEKAFANCINLSEMNFPEGLKVIESKAFENCYTLTNVNFKEGIEIIKSNTFEDCPYLKSIILPISLKIIEKDAFKNCNNIKKIYYRGSSEQWNTINIDESNNGILTATKEFSN